ncbi:MAG: hypothetical protein Q4E37_02145 [Tissierellia bacterium]|nr:hypothetical protein [Tissierellia bacterium]
MEGLIIFILIGLYTHYKRNQEKAFKDLHEEGAPQEKRGDFAKKAPSQGQKKKPGTWVLPSKRQKKAIPDKREKSWAKQKAQKAKKGKKNRDQGQKKKPDYILEPERLVEDDYSLSAYLRDKEADPASSNKEDLETDKLLEGIIMSEILGPPASQREDRF